MLSELFKTLFVHVPKTAGQSVEQVFVEKHGLTWKTRGALLLGENHAAGGIPKQLAHLYAVEYCSQGHVTPEMFASCYKFSIVRNPYDRALSEYRYKARRRPLTMEAFAAKLQDGEADRHLVPQSNFVLDHDGRNLLGRVIKFENLAAEFDEISTGIFGRPAALPHRNKSAEGGPAEFGPELRNLIYKRYERDFDLFQYASGRGYHNMNTGIRRNAPDEGRPVSLGGDPQRQSARITSGNENPVAEDSARITANVAVVAQGGRIGYQALLCAASIRRYHPENEMRIFVCVPRNSELWKTDPGLQGTGLEEAFARYGCELVFFDNVHWGSSYPHSNKFYTLLSLPAHEPFLFLDSDTIFARAATRGDFDFVNPALKTAGPTWPVASDEGYTIAEIWRSLYEFFGLDPSGYFVAQDESNLHQCFPYYQGNVIYFREAGVLGQTMLDMALRLWREQPKQLQRQPLTPWLDQIVLPLALARLGVARRIESDPIRDVIVHYQYPMFLLLPDGRPKKPFARLLEDPWLASALRQDKGFDYYLSEQGRDLFRAAYHEAAKSKGASGGRKNFKRLIRKRAPIMR